MMVMSRKIRGWMDNDEDHDYDPVFSDYENSKDDDNNDKDGSIGGKYRGADK